MSLIREPAVAGRFYPADPEALGTTVQSCFERAPLPKPGAACPRALIVPHAGYVYSGVAAATAFAHWRAHRTLIWRVVLLGPSHHVPFRGLALTTADSYRTPLGEVHLDTASVSRLTELPGVRVLDQAHVPEHSLEVQLPFLQSVLGEFMLLPIVVGDADPAQVVAVLESLGEDEGTVFVISSDLSHYLDDASARSLDARTCQAIESLDAAALGDDQACGRIPVKGLLLLAKRRGWKAVTLALCNSGDSGAGRERVVGYGSWAFYTDSSPSGRLSSSDRDTLKSIAWASIRNGLREGRPLTVNPAVYPALLAANGAAFVTLNKDGELRGCIGSLEARRPLVEDVAQHAWDAAFNDPRFPPVTAEELDTLDMHISLLVPPEPFPVRDEADLVSHLRSGIDGIILEEGSRRATFLPAVWSQLPDPRDFLTHLKRKGGWPAGYWSPRIKVWRYAVEEF